MSAGAVVKGRHEARVPEVDAPEGARGLASRATSAIEAGGGLLPAVPLWLWWAASEGGYPASLWLGGLVYLAVWSLLLVRYVRPAALSRPAWVALVAMAGLTVWTALSAAWAPDPGGAWLAAERVALAGAALALPILWPPTGRALLIGLGGFVAAAAVAATIGLVSALAHAGSLEDGRLTDPTGYPNATAALLLAAALPALLLASHRGLGVRWRALALASGGCLAAISILAQSRGSMIAAAIALVALIALTPSPLRALTPLAIAAVGTAAALKPLLDVHAAAIAGDPGDELRIAAVALVALFVLLAGAGVLYARLDDRRRAVRTGNPARERVVVLAVAGLLALAGGAVITDGRPAAWLDARVDEATNPDYARIEASADRFTAGADSNRIDYWRVSLQVTGDHPLAGDGAGSFAGDYLARRHTDKGPLYAHSLWLGDLAELGVPGLALLLCAVGSVGFAIARSRRHASEGARLALAAASLPAIYLLVHASFDWVSYFPALLVPAVGLAGAAAGLRAPDAPGADQGRRRPAAIAVAALLAAAVVGLPLAASNWLVDRAYSTAPERPQQALSEARLAGDLDPFGPRPALAEGQVALEIGDLDSAEQAFSEAAARDSAAWYPRFELGLLEAGDGNRAVALGLLEQAAERNPRERLIDRAVRSVRSGRPLDPSLMARRVLAEAG